MNNLIKGLLLLLISLSSCSCITSYYMGNSGMEPIVFTKPAYRDSTRVSDFIGGKITTSPDSTFNRSDETNSFGQIYWFRTHTHKYYNFSYGAFGYLGNYKVTAVKELAGNKSYFGGGVSADICANIPLDVIDIRIAGLKGTLYYEDGDYRKFRLAAINQKLALASTELLGYNLSETFGFDIKLTKKNSIGCYTSNGISGQFISGERFFTSSNVINYQTNRFTLFMQASSTWLRGFSNPFGLDYEFSLGLNYRL